MHVCLPVLVLVLTAQTPITEIGFAGLAVGAAFAGTRPVVEFSEYEYALRLAMRLDRRTACSIAISSYGVCGHARCGQPAAWKSGFLLPIIATVTLALTLHHTLTPISDMELRAAGH
jgi:hypothetical protein